MLEKASIKATNWIGTPLSIVVHTLLFVGIFFLYLIGFSFDSILLILTTAVSLEAIYLAIFIQMTVNRNTQSLEAVEDDIDELQEDVEDITEDVEDLSEDVGEIQETDHTKAVRALEQIEKHLRELQIEIHQLKKNQ